MVLKPGQLFDPETFSPEQAAALNNVPGQSLSQTNTPAQITAAQNIAPGAGLISSSTDYRVNGAKTGAEITQFADSLGVEPPKGGVSDTVKEIIEGIKSRQTELSKRETEDIAGIEREFETGSEELKLAQEEERSRREGRTRIGGFLVKTEVDELETMYRQHRVETANLLGQKRNFIQQAQRARADGDFTLSQSLLDNARKIEKEEYDKQQDYFNNVIKAQQLHERLQKPIKDAEQADIDQAIGWMEAAPSAFKDIKPSDIALGRISFGEIQARYLDSDEYAKSLESEAPASVEEYNYLLKNGQIPKGTSYIDYQKMKATQFGTEGGSGGTEPLDVLNVARYKELYPDAGIEAGDTEAEANAKVLRMNQPRTLTDSELKTAITVIKDQEKGSYETAISEIDNDPLISNKDRAKQLVDEAYGKKPKTAEEQKIEGTIDQLQSGGKLTDADIRYSLRKQGYSQEAINKSSIGQLGYSLVDSISNFLFK